MTARLAARLHILTRQNGGKSRSPSDMVDDARALLMEMGEPTASMIRRGGEVDADGSQDNARDVWQAMLREALAEPVEG
jgi:hypothetical protein